MKNSYWLSILMLVALLGGCSKQDDDAAVAPQQQGKLPDDNVFSDQVKTMDKAKAVQQTLDAAVAKQKTAIDEQSR